MKALNNIKFLTEATTQFNAYLNVIDESESYEHASTAGKYAFGFIDCMIVYLNSMLAAENNDFTEQLDCVLDDWRASVYQHIADKAIETNQNTDLILDLLKKRDAARA